MPGFASGFLRRSPIAASSIYPLSNAKAAYAAVIIARSHRAAPLTVAVGSCIRTAFSFEKPVGGPSK